MLLTGSGFAEEIQALDVCPAGLYHLTIVYFAIVHLLWYTHGEFFTRL